MVQKTMQYAQGNANMVPTHVDMAELDRDNAAWLLPDTWIPVVKLILNNMENTKILLDYDVYQTCFTIYRHVRYLAKENVSGMSAIYNDLKQFFPDGSVSPEAPAMPQ